MFLNAWVKIYVMIKLCVYWNARYVKSRKMIGNNYEIYENKYLRDLISIISECRMTWFNVIKIRRLMQSIVPHVAEIVSNDDL